MKKCPDCGMILSMGNTGYVGWHAFDCPRKEKKNNATI